jgi:CRISPR/Cas system-associated exonuclease Cas4 (RecB family)
MSGVKAIPPQQKPSRPLDRFPRDVVGASYIAEQAYCEKRVELWLTDPGPLVSVPPEIEGRAPEAILQEHLAQTGSQFHEGASEGAPLVAIDEVRARLLAGEQLVLLESRFSGDYRSVPLAGMPDAVCFKGLSADCVIEYKVTDSNQLQTSHRVQLLIYGFLLQQQGFDVSDLLLSCILVPRRQALSLGSLSPPQIEQLVNTIRAVSRATLSSDPTRRNWYVPNLEPIPGTTLTLRFFKYETDAATRELDFFTAFWLGLRPAKPTTKATKCMACLYNSLAICPDALVPYSGRPFGEQSR